MNLYKNICLFTTVLFMAACSSNNETETFIFSLDSSLNNWNDSNSIACDSTLWAYVYTPSRFKVLQKCVELTGIIRETPTIEGDGDYHILLKLDPGQQNYLNSKNYILKDSCLVVETVCAARDHENSGETKTTLFYDLLYSDLPQCCENYVNKVYIPKKGEHVRVRGPLVIDLGKYDIVKHGWREIHPANKIEIIK